MRVEGSWLHWDSLFIGFQMGYGEDKQGVFHRLSIGLLIFEINFDNFVDL